MADLKKPENDVKNALAQIQSERDTALARIDEWYKKAMDSLAATRAIMLTENGPALDLVRDSQIVLFKTFEVVADDRYTAAPLIDEGQVTVLMDGWRGQCQYTLRETSRSFGPEKARLAPGRYRMMLFVLPVDK